MRYWKPKTIPANPKVGIAVASYLLDDSRRRASLKCLLYALQAQTWVNWVCEITHDGPGVEIGEFNDIDPRIKFMVTHERKGSHGHPHRQGALNRLMDQGCDWLLMTNDDNYYVPVFLEWLLSEAYTDVGDLSCDMVWCDMVHSHKLWQPLQTMLCRGRIDLGGFLVHRDVARKVPFDDHSFAGDWTYVERICEQTMRTVRKVYATLFVHN